MEHPKKVQAVARAPSSSDIKAQGKVPPQISTSDAQDTLFLPHSLTQGFQGNVGPSKNLKLQTQAIVHMFAYVCILHVPV